MSNFNNFQNYSEYDDPERGPQPATPEEFADEVFYQYGLRPQPEVAAIWYEEYLNGADGLEDFVLKLYLDDMRSLNQWAEPGEPAPK